ncbi:hypothetical protein OIU76_028522 [Salix suchowensis]|nr:hypothetical protein OIU76_028522 [Salix suchowensis]
MGTGCDGGVGYGDKEKKKKPIRVGGGLGLMESHVEFDMGWIGMLPLHELPLRNIPYAQTGWEVQRLMAQTLELMILVDYKAYLRSLIVSYPLILLKLFSL